MVGKAWLGLNKLKRTRGGQLQRQEKRLRKDRLACKSVVEWAVYCYFQSKMESVQTGRDRKTEKKEKAEEKELAMWLGAESCCDEGSTPEYHICTGAAYR